MTLVQMMKLSLMRFSTILITNTVMGRADGLRNMSEPQVCPQSTLPQERSYSARREDSCPRSCMKP